MPSIVAGTVLLFASSMGAYATAQALIGSRINLMTIQISILRRGEILYQPAQADAMATVLLAIVALIGARLPPHPAPRLSGGSKA